MKKSIFLAVLALITSYGITTPAYSNDNTILWAGCGITKKAFMKELATAFEKKTGIHVVLEGGGATRGIRDAAAGKIHIGGSCRMSLPDADKSETYAKLHPVAWDALAIIVNKNNPIDNLTTQQVKDIYLGKIHNWKSVGSSDRKLKLYVRQGKISGVGYAIRQYIFKDGGIDFKTSYVVTSSGPLEKAVENDIEAIGITGVSSARKRDVKIIKFDGKEPSYENVKNGTYGLYRPLYLVISPNASPEVKQLVKFATSKEGKQILRDNGTVPYHDALNLMSKMTVYGIGVR